MDFSAYLCPHKSKDMKKFSIIFKVKCIEGGVLEKDVISEVGMNRTKFYTLLKAEGFTEAEKKKITKAITKLSK